MSALRGSLVQGSTTGPGGRKERERESGGGAQPNSQREIDTSLPLK